MTALHLMLPMSALCTFMACLSITMAALMAMSGRWWVANGYCVVATAFFALAALLRDAAATL